MPVSAPAPSHLADHPQTRALRLLLVEDNRTSQRVLQLMLGKPRHHVDIVADGEQTLQAAHQVGYDIILMDVQMPVMNGLEVTRRIRKELPSRVPSRTSLPCPLALGWKTRTPGWQLAWTISCRSRSVSRSCGTP